MIELNADYTMQQKIFARKGNTMELCRKNDDTGTKYKIKLREIKSSLANSNAEEQMKLEVDNKEWRKTQNISNPDYLLNEELRINLPDMNMYAVCEVVDIIRAENIDVQRESNIKRCSSCGLLNEKAVTLKNKETEMIFCPHCLAKLNGKIGIMLEKVNIDKPVEKKKHTVESLQIPREDLDADE